MAFCAYCGTQLAEVSYAPCPNCGNPSNGAPQGTVAPAAAPAKGGSKTAVIVIGVVVGLFVIIGVLGIIAAIAIPNLVTAAERAKSQRTMADLRTIATAVEAYATDHNQYPNATSIDALGPFLTPTYLRELPRTKDAWMHDFRYAAWTRTNELDSYAVGSAGKDGIWQYDSVEEYTQGLTGSFDCDIIFSNGNFVQYPERAKSR
ncbi:MAG TPA: type II secretion system protein GspG [Thermoanaerobaculia bacterium]|nr:type II secretion system protein GspG [Thermoanaerobaculia bacterium]